ncbi:hypothetical protein [Alteribacillus bidgolensis]|uniref:hypothetical protein n=1 Tax=Alteribacillus bidgolensis TaxID=930129 RepID=UPI001475758C|nr:hypothetical protein [Alteribacillus bidgolensis]
MVVLLDIPTLIGGSIWVAAGLLYLVYLTKSFRDPLPEYKPQSSVTVQEEKAV